MLRWLRGMWRWHRKAEGNQWPSESLSLHGFIVLSSNRYRLLNRLCSAGFCFVFRQKSRLPGEAFSRHTRRLAVIGSFLSGFGTLTMM